MFERKHRYFTVILLGTLSLLSLISTVEATVYVYQDVILAGVTVLTAGATLVNGTRLVKGNPSFTKGFGGFLIGSIPAAIVIAAMADGGHTISNREWVATVTSFTQVSAGGVSWYM